MWRFLLLLVLFTIAGRVLAQDEIIVSGRVLDASTNDDLPFASVSLKIPGEDQLITGVRKKVINGKGYITVNFSDIFNHFGIRHEIYGDAVNIVYENWYETQVLRIGFRYKF